VGACSDSETVVAVTINSGSEIGVVSRLRVTVTPMTGAAAVSELVPPADLDGGAILSSFFVRVNLPDDPEGPASILAQALDSAGTVIAVGTATTTLRSKGAVAASIMLTPGATPPAPDGGSSDPDGGTPDATDGGADSD